MEGGERSFLMARALNSFLWGLQGSRVDARPNYSHVAWQGLGRARNIVQKMEIRKWLKEVGVVAVGEGKEVFTLSFETNAFRINTLSELKIQCVCVRVCPYKCTWVYQCVWVCTCISLECVLSVFVSVYACFL